MAVWNEKFYKGNDVYSDGSIEDEILDIVCRDDYEEKKDELIGNNYTIAYHLTPIRENILNWYPFKKNQSAIEIGAGCGAITGMLCRKLGKVVSVDLSKRRSKINYERHKQYDNLEIVIGNFNDMDLGELYDYVILNGVFEYAISFTESDRPYHDFLRHISKFLKPNGKFLISIENKLGLKYFNGAKEDHTGNYFLGLNEYAGNETVRTFSKTELEEILAEEGYKYTNFYYPYPDYKFPSEVFTEESMEANQYGRPMMNIEDNRYWLFDENKVGKALLKENIRNVFANSFLVEASKEQFETEVIYAKLNVERKPEFQIGTSIVRRDGKKTVEKYPLHDAAKSHINRVYETTKTVGKEVNYLAAEQKVDVISFEFLNDKNLDTDINSLIDSKKADEIYRVLDTFFEKYLGEFAHKEKTPSYRTELFRTYFGDAAISKEFLCVKNANIDVIMDNIYKIEERYTLIDGEWIYPEWIPYSFLIWRAVNELYAKHTDLESIISRRKLLEHYEVSLEDEEVFHAWAIHFAEVYVGGSIRKQWAKPVEAISLDDIHRERYHAKNVMMSLYVDTGCGFSEEEKLFMEVNIEQGTFDVVFDSPKLKEAKQLRFDPVEGTMCSLKIEDISDGVKVIGDNAKERNKDGFLFVNTDPQILLQTDTGNSEIRMKGKIKIFEKEQLLDYMQEILKEIETYKETIVRQYAKIETMTNELERLEKEKNHLSKENEKNYYLANSTKAFLKRKVLLKLGKYTD